LKTKFIALIIAAMFPLGAIAQNAGVQGSDSSDPSGMRSGVHAGVQGSGSSDAAHGRMHSRNDGRGFNRGFGRGRFVSDRPQVNANESVPDQGVAMALQFGTD
jgi:hypothetical protein